MTAIKTSNQIPSLDLFLCYLLQVSDDSFLHGGGDWTNVIIPGVSPVAVSSIDSDLTSSSSSTFRLDSDF